MIFERFTKAVSNLWTEETGIPCHAHVASVDQLTFEEFSRAIPTPTFLASFKGEPLNGLCIAEIDPGICSTLIEFLMGGSKSHSRSIIYFSDVEIEIISKIFDKMVPKLDNAFCGLVDLKFSRVYVDTNPQSLMAASPHDMTILVTMEVKVGDTEGMMNFCLPGPWTDQIRNKLTARKFYGEIAEPETKLSMDHLNAEIIAQLDDRPTCIRELLKLKVGDVIPVSRQKVALVMGGQKIMKGKRAVKNGREAIIVEEV
jgi:flagellar motor switch protein FliM